MSADRLAVHRHVEVHSDRGIDGNIDGIVGRIRRSHHGARSRRRADHPDDYYKSRDGHFTDYILEYHRNLFRWKHCTHFLVYWHMMKLEVFRGIVH
jgi:hypothetical protein